MKKIIKKSLIVTGIISAGIILVVIGFYLVAFSELKKMTPFATGRITDRIYAIKDDHVNMYVFCCDSGLILVDAGNDFDFAFSTN